jgi:hypothetical protein
MDDFLSLPIFMAQPKLAINNRQKTPIYHILIPQHYESRNPRLCDTWLNMTATCAMLRVTLPEQIEPFATEREFEQAEAGEIMSHNLGLRDS